MMEKRAVLGKGLSALISSTTDENIGGVSQKTAEMIKTADIQYNSLQPRLNYAQDGIEELKVSIKEKGILQPILVRPTETGFEVVAGERRLRAAQSLGIEFVPAVVKDVSDDEALVLALIENIQREELNAIEEARAFKRLMEEFQLSQEQVADAVGKNRTTIANLLRLLRLPSAIQDGVINGLVSMGHARALLSIENEQRQYQVFLDIMKKGLSVRQVEEMSRSSVRGQKKAEKKSQQRDHEVVRLEEELRGIFGTKVLVEAKKKMGKVVIEYYSLDDLDRILEIIRN